MKGGSTRERKTNRRRADRGFPASAPFAAQTAAKATATRNPTTEPQKKY
jgi:hypothetical protein